jgi:predicted HTH transcriptional regulator
MRHDPLIYEVHLMNTIAFVIESWRIREAEYHGCMGTERAHWTFLTNHGHVLLCIAADPGIRGREIAERVGITERAAQAIIADLVREGYVNRTRVGRRNHYQVNPELPLRHPVESAHHIGELLALVADLGPSQGAATDAP